MRPWVGPYPLAREEAFPVQQEQYKLSLVFPAYNYVDCGLPMK